MTTDATPPETSAPGAASPEPKPAPGPTPELPLEKASRAAEPFRPFAPHVADPPKVDPSAEPTPFIERPKTIRMLWIGSAVVLALLVLADLFVHHHEPHFVIETSIGFSAWYGFATCVAMVVLSKKVIGFVLKRKDTYYEPPPPPGQLNHTDQGESA